MQKRGWVKRGERTNDRKGGEYLRIGEHDFRRAEGPAPLVTIQVGAGGEYAPDERVVKPVSVG
jgi:hypothetical protein